MIKLFLELLNGEWFHFGDSPNRFHVKLDRTHRISPEGRRVQNEHVAVFPERLPGLETKSIYDQTKDGEK